MSRQERVMLLIDADNVSVDVMEQAVRLLHNQHGAVHVRRAYCTPESALKHQGVFKRLAIKPMVNLAAGKNSTDIALAVDAIDLVMAERPDVVVIASSDSDFAPLVQRLREKGCVVRGIGQLGKTGDETQDVYDDFTVLEHRKAAGAARKSAPAPAPARKRGSRAPASRSSNEPTAPPRPAPAPEAEAQPVPAPAPTPTPIPSPAPARKAARKTAAKAKAEAAATASAETVAETAPAEAPAKPVRKRAAKAAAPADAAPAPEPAAAKPAAAKTAARKTAARKTAKAAKPAPAPAPAEPPPPPADPRLQALLACLPELAKGQPLALNVAVQRLRAAQLLGKNSSSLKFFAQWGDRVELLPPDKPAQVRLRG